jgi:uridylate kinase
MMLKKLYVLSLGGSLIVPDQIDVTFLKKFRQLIIDQTKQGHRFIIVTGGGKTSRRYQESYRKIMQAGNGSLDLLGIAATRLNAKLIKLMFGKLAHDHIVTDPTKKVLFKEKILVAGGWNPGNSTDYVATRLAKTYNSQTIINLSNIDYVYDKDPRKHKDAKKIENISWKEFRKLVGTTWDPGANVPFDPVAAKFASENHQQVIIANGKNLNNLENLLKSQKAKGTQIA